jgi:hypothetical protein
VRLAHAGWAIEQQPAGEGHVERPKHLRVPRGVVEQLAQGERDARIGVTQFRLRRRGCGALLLFQILLVLTGRNYDAGSRRDAPHPALF